jgi:hypothetical protein
MANRRLYLIVQHITATDYGLYAGTQATSTGAPVLALDNEEKAIGQAGKLEREARKVIPPFHVGGGPETWSRLGTSALRESLEKLGLRDLPAADIEEYKAGRHWRRWWDEHGGELSPDQVEAVWKLLDLVEFYEVVRVWVRD